MKRIVALLVALAAAGALSAASDPTIGVTGGRIRGAPLHPGGAVFKGIPYAQPPAGDLRWREPQPVEPWPGVRDATQFGRICAQKASFIVPDATEISGEDCLFLNVWTAEWPSRSRRPVMVWIPGGGNFAGGSHEVSYDGERLARRGVVVVTVNYRLGPFGFFAHPALTRESRHRASGNQGILDQIAALGWVRDNIAGFGGDPENVTIFGESAGGLNVSVLMTSPPAAGLFHRAVTQSGAVIVLGDPLSLADAEKRGASLAARWKVPADAPVDRLRGVPAEDILSVEPNYLSLGHSIADVFPNLGITVDAHVFHRKPADVFAAGQQHRVPLLLGSNAREQVPGSRPPADLARAIAETYGPLADRALRLYAGATDPDHGTPAEQWGTDTSFRCAAVAQAIWHAAAGNPTYQYEFARVPAGREALGSTHASEISHVFGTIDRGIFGVGPPAKATEVDARVSDVMQEYWTNFAKIGDPNGDARLPRWPRFEPSSRAYIQFTDAGPVVRAGLRREACDLFLENHRR